MKNFIIEYRFCSIWWFINCTLFIFEMIKRYKFTHCSCWNHNEWNYDLSLWHLVTHAYIIYSYSPFFLIRCFDSLIIHGITAFHGQFYHNFYDKKVTLHNVSQGWHFITLFCVKCIFMLVPIVAPRKYNTIKLRLYMFCFGTSHHFKVSYNECHAHIQHAPNNCKRKETRQTNYINKCNKHCKVWIIT